MSKVSRWSFAALMLALTGVFVALGSWQVQRLAEKEALVATVAARADAEAMPVPPASSWPIAVEQFDYQPVTLRGRYHPEGTVLVFTSIADARGERSGPGYWVMTPMALTEGGTVFVNRGFIPQAEQGNFKLGGDIGTDEVELLGLARRSEEVSSFTPKADTGNRIEWVRNTDRLAGMADPSLAPFANITVDLPAGPPGTLPQGGETVISFPNNHLGYALTWFGFALMTPVLLAFWLRRGEAKSAPDAGPPVA